MYHLIKPLILACVVFGFGRSVHADQWQRYWNGSGYSYRRVPVAYVNHSPYVAYVPPKIEKKIENTTTVVNNLIGIPVPVNYNQPIAEQGTTVYGYSSAAEAYGSVDLGLLYNQAARLTDQAQQLAGQATADFASLVQAEGQNRADVARILAQGQAAAQALSATSQGNYQQAQNYQRSFTLRITQGSDGRMHIEQVPDNNNDNNSLDLVTPRAAVTEHRNISDLIKNKCYQCHSQQKPSGGLDFSKELTDAQQEEIIKRIETNNSSLKMPRNADGTAGKLTNEEITLFKQALGISR